MNTYKKIYLIVLAMFILEFIIILSIVFFSALSGSEEFFSKDTWLQKIILPFFCITIFVFLILSAFFPTEYTGKMQYPDKEEQKRYEQRIARDKTKIKEAIENKNMNILFMLAKEYIEMGYWVEEAELLTKIVELDPNGFYGKQAKKLLEPDDIKLKDDKGIGLTEEADREIKALEKNHWADILSPKKALSLAEAYQRYGLTEEALLRYFEILLNFKKSTEAKAAKIAFDELIKNNNFDPELIKSLEEDLKTKREGIGLKIISLIKTAAKKLLNLTVF